MGQDRVEYQEKLDALIGAADKVAELLDEYTPRNDEDCEEAEALRQYEHARLVLLQREP